MTTTTATTTTTSIDADSLQQYKSRCSLLVEHTLPFTLSTNLVKEVQNLSPHIKRIAEQCFTLWIILIRVGRSILSLGYKFCHKSCSNSLDIVNRTYLSLQLNLELATFPRNFSFILVNCQ